MRRLINFLVKLKNIIPNTIWKKSPTVFLVVLGLVPLIWFVGKGNVLINGIDTNFPLNPLVWFTRRLYVWNSVANAGVDFSSSTAGLFFHFIQTAPFFLGFNLQTIEIISLVFWFSLIVFSAYVFARTILPKKFHIQLLFVVFYSFNIYLFNSWENIKVANLSLVASIPLALSILTLLRESRISLKKALFYSALVGVVISGTGINPSYFITLFIILTLYSLGMVVSERDRRGVILRCKELVLLAAVIILVNSFWIFPTLNYIFNNISSSGSIDTIGFNNWVDSLSENTSLVNVLRLQGAWDWYAFDWATGFPLYIPYALNYFYRLPFLAFSFLIPGFAILSLMIREKKKSYLYLSFGLMLILGVFLGAGTHLPSGQIFRLLLNKLPFFSLFRSPWYIFTPLVSLSTAGLVALLLYSLDEKFLRLNFRLSRYITAAFVLVLIAGNLVYSYPLVTGKIFRPGRADSFYIQFPTYVYDAFNWLGSQKPEGRIVEYPDEEITEFVWGYRGVESILNLSSGWDSLFPPLNSPDANISKLIKKYYLNIKNKSIEASTNLAYKLGISYLFEKKDTKSLALALPDEIRKLPSVNFSDKWFFYKVLNEPVLRVYAPENFYLASPFARSDEAISVLPPRATLLNPEDKIIKEIGVLSKNAGKLVIADNSQTKDLYDFFHTPSNLANRLIARDMGKVDFTFDIPEDGFYEPILEKNKLEEFGIGSAKELEIKVDGQASTWVIQTISDSYMYFEKVNFKKGNYVISLTLNNMNLIPGGNFQGDVKYKKESGSGGRAVYSTLTDGENKYLSMLNIGKVDISADFSIPNFDQLASYYIELMYKQVYGNNALVLAGQSNKFTLIKTQQERLPNYPEWSVFSFYYDPVKTDSDMKVILSAPFINDPFGTKVLYDNLSVYRVFTNNLLFIKEGKTQLIPPNVSVEKVSPVKYRVKVANAKGPHVLILSENYSPDWEVSLTGQKDINFKQKHFSANIYANAWYLENTPADYELEIYYTPQRLFAAGLVVGTLTLLGLLAMLRKI